MSCAYCLFNLARLSPHSSAISLLFHKCNEEKILSIHKMDRICEFRCCIPAGVFMLRYAVYKFHRSQLQIVLAKVSRTQIASSNSTGVSQRIQSRQIVLTRSHSILPMVHLPRAIYLWGVTAYVPRDAGRCTRHSLTKPREPLPMIYAR